MPAPPTNRLDPFDQAPPCDPEAEAALLGSLLLEPALLRTEGASLETHHFRDQQHAILLATMRKLVRAGQPIDEIVLVGELSGNPLFGSKPGAAAFLAKIAKATPTTTHVALYRDRVIEAWRKRKLREAALDAFQGASNGQSVAGILTALRDELDQVENVSTGRREPTDIADLIDEFPDLKEEIIDGILRRGETANIIAAAKTGKSWLVYGIALSVATGRPWLNRFPCKRGRVLLIDNELQRETLVSRVPTVAHEMDLVLEDYRGQLKVESLRGALKDLPRLMGELFDHRGPAEFDLVILDAWYRAIPEGVSENDNAQIMQLYNLIDRYTTQLDAAWINIHHSSKGEQGGKAVVDVGAGAGSQARAADAHIVLRTHEEPGAAVLDAALRSFPPIAPLPVRFEWPLWTPDARLDPGKVKGRRTGQEQRQTEQDRQGIKDIQAALSDAPATLREIRRRTGGMGQTRSERLVAMMEKQGAVVSEEIRVRGNDCRQYRLSENVVHEERTT
ncbi:MAG: AAA family ATPase [Planctomycetales bacterium]|nr:AAA family ATPase [Planctomycetales bacterium]